MKDIYGNQESGQSIFNFKPQQLLQTSPGSSIPLQVTQHHHHNQAKTTANIQSMVAPIPKIISTTPAQYVIRTQQPIGSTAIVQPKVPLQTPKQQQFISLVVTPTGVKVQEDASKLINTQVSIQNKLPEQNVKRVVTTPQVLLNSQQKTFQIIQNTPKPIAISQKPSTTQPTYKVFQKEIRQIQPASTIVTQLPSQVLMKTKPSGVQQPSTWKTLKVINQAAPAKPQNISTSTPIVLKSQQIPALAPIQRKILPIPSPLNSVSIENKQVLCEESSQESLIEQNDEEFLNVKRIIEGDNGLNSYVNSAENGSKLNEEEKINQEEEEIMKDKCSEVITSQSEILNEQQAALSSDSLLCDEQIESISPEISPNDKEKENECALTPIQSTSEINFKTMAMESVKKTLNLDMVPSGSDEKIQLRIEVEEDDSVISDDTNISMLKNITADNENDSLHSKSELSLVASGEKKPSKRSRKTKNPTVNTNLGLPYKPPTNNNRKKKVEKKMELELDFHDPLNKIMWEDGIGGLNNCHKLFGFDEFGLVEVVTKKDATAKIGRYENNNFESSNFKLQKIIDPENQFVCVVCSKNGTIRDFFSPECCSEACLAITKRKSFEYGARDDQHDSGQSSPTTDSKKIIYDGESIPFQQLQTYLLKMKLPGRKREEIVMKAPLSTSTSSDENFSWSAYLNSKSIPAPSDLFMNFRQQQTYNPFKVGMKLEAIDPKNPQLFCVCSVEERLGHRIKLHFDGFSSAYDFWVDAGSKNIFPIEFCRTTKRQLQVPPRWPNKNFDWSEYLDAQNSAGANRQMFPHLMKREDGYCLANIGMKLEVLKDDAWYVATIVDILGDRMLIKFDGMYEHYGHTWFEFNSPYIGPCNVHKSDEETTIFYPPIGTPETFSWDCYLKSTSSEEVPENFFSLHEPLKNEFEPGMKLEVVDKVNPQLIRPATILSHSDYKIQINFDGFDISYSYWLDYDSEDIYPINYCKQTGHPIEHPAGHCRGEDDAICSTAGCRGVGNGIYTDRDFHERNNECPYNLNNWKKLLERKSPNRLENKQHHKR